MVSILGAGAFGTAMAVTLAKRQGAVTLWARDMVSVSDMVKIRRNDRYLRGIDIPDNIVLTHNLEKALMSNIICLSVPMQQLSNVLNV